MVSQINPVVLDHFFVLHLGDTWSSRSRRLLVEELGVPMPCCLVLQWRPSCKKLQSKAERTCFDPPLSRHTHT